MVNSSKRIFGACVLSAGLLLAPQAAPAAIYWQSGEDWVIGDAPDGSTFTETNNGNSKARGLDRGKVDEPLSNSGFFSTTPPTSSIGTAAIARESGELDQGTWTTDLAGVYAIDRIELHHAGTNGWHGRYGMTVSYSVNGIDWTDIGSVSTINPNGTAQSSTVPIDFENAQVRFLRLQYSNGSNNFHHRMDRMDLYMVPEPASLMLVGAAGAMLLGRRGRGSRTA